MPEAAPTPHRHFATIEEAVSDLRGRGLRLSTARRLVLEAIFAAEGPVSAQQLAGELGVDLTSVYRNLELLERFGVVGHVHLAHGAGLYMLTGRQEAEYLYCERCGGVTPVTAEVLEPARAVIRERFGFEARFSHFAIVGLCRRCSADPSDSAPSASQAAPR